MPLNLKKIYTLLGVITILISSLMILNNTIIIFMEKIKQINLLNKLGLNLKKFLCQMFFKLSVINYYNIKFYSLI